MTRLGAVSRLIPTLVAHMARFAVAHDVQRVAWSRNHRIWRMSDDTHRRDPSGLPSTPAPRATKRDEALRIKC